MDYCFTFNLGPLTEIKTNFKDFLLPKLLEVLGKDPRQESLSFTRQPLLPMSEITVKIK
jgi:hypothetical protein